MESERGIAGIPKEGFIKTGRPKQANLTAQQKAALIRKGNELFNAGNLEQAKKVFLTTGYTDGIVRIGDYYYKKNELFEAFRMYWLAPAPDKKDLMISMMATTVQKWLKEDGGSQL